MTRTFGPEVGSLRALRDATALAVSSSPWHAALNVTLTVASGLLPPLTAFLLAGLLQEVSDHHRSGALPWAGAMLATAALAAALPPAVEFSKGELSRRVAARVQDRFFGAVGRIQGLARFEEPSFRDELSIAEQASETAPLTITDSLTAVGQTVISVLAFGTLIASRQPVAATVLALTLVPVTWAHFRESRHQLDLMWTTTPAGRRRFFYSSLLFDLQALKEVRLYGLSDFFRGRMARELRTVQTHARHQAVRALRLGLVSALFTAVGFGAVLLGAVADPGTDVGGLTLMVASAVGFQTAFLASVDRASHGWRAVSMFATYTRVIATIDAEVPPSHRREVPEFEELRFESVSFSYESSAVPAVRGVSFVLRRGESVGLVGPNGAGKSTVIKLLTRLYEPTSGRITWNGIDVSCFDAEAFRRQLGVVFQDFMTYELSLGENIGLGDLARLTDRTAIARAAAMVGVDDLADELVSGYDTSLSRVFDPDQEGAGSTTLSGGQWQRVAIARALMRSDRSVLILDEPTSGMDARREELVSRALFKPRPHQATLCISHRLSTIRDCDRILVMDRGSIQEQGSHYDLMDEHGLYCELFTAQSRGYDPA